MTSDNLTTRPFMTVKQVADTLSVNRNTVYGWIEKGVLESMVLPGGNAYRIPQSAFEKFIDKISRSVRQADGLHKSRKVCKRNGKFFDKGQKVRRITEKS